LSVVWKESVLRTFIVTEGRSDRFRKH